MADPLPAAAGCGGEPRPLVDENDMMRDRASKLDCESCSLKPRCYPNAPARKILRSIEVPAIWRDIAATDAYVISPARTKENRDAVRPSQAHPGAPSAAITRTERCTRRIPPRRHRTKPPQAGQAVPGAAADLSNLRRCAFHQRYRDRQPSCDYFQPNFLTESPQRGLCLSSVVEGDHGESGPSIWYAAPQAAEPGSFWSLHIRFPGDPARHLAVLFDQIGLLRGQILSPIAREFR